LDFSLMPAWRESAAPGQLTMPDLFAMFEP
jgi:hypothetical protein